MTPTPQRAPRMSQEERRDHILDVVVPLIMEHGVEVTTRQIADAAGIAEGTIFRAFADKDELIDQAVDRFMDPEPTFLAIEALDPAAPLAAKVREIVTIFRRRSEGIVGMMSALGHRKHGAHRHHHDEARQRAEQAFARLFAPNAAEMRVDRDLSVLFMRLLSFGASMPMFTDQRDITTDEIVDFVMRGIAKEAR